MLISHSIIAHLLFSPRDNKASSARSASHSKAPALLTPSERKVLVSSFARAACCVSSTPACLVILIINNRVMDASQAACQRWPRRPVMGGVALTSPPRLFLWPTPEVLAWDRENYAGWNRSALSDALSPFEDVAGLIIISSPPTKVWNKMVFSRLFSLIAETLKTWSERTRGTSPAGDVTPLPVTRRDPALVCAGGPKQANQMTFTLYHVSLATFPFYTPRRHIPPSGVMQFVKSSVEPILSMALAL